jgi:hypothetical protein
LETQHATETDDEKEAEELNAKMTISEEQVQSAKIENKISHFAINKSMTSLTKLC